MCVWVSVTGGSDVFQSIYHHRAHAWSRCITIRALLHISEVPEYDFRFKQQNFTRKTHVGKGHQMGALHSLNLYSYWGDVCYEGGTPIDFAFYFNWVPLYDHKITCLTLQKPFRGWTLLLGVACTRGACSESHFKKIYSHPTLVSRRPIAHVLDTWLSTRWSPLVQTFQRTLALSWCMIYAGIL